MTSSMSRHRPRLFPFPFIIHYHSVFIHWTATKQTQEMLLVIYSNNHKELFFFLFRRCLRNKLLFIMILLAILTLSKAISKYIIKCKLTHNDSFLGWFWFLGIQALNVQWASICHNMLVRNLYFYNTVPQEQNFRTLVSATNIRIRSLALF
jgi:hypothetical protein